MQQTLASIHPDAQIGKDVIIGPFVTIEEDVIIGDGTRIDSNASILKVLELVKIAIYVQVPLLAVNPKT